MNSWIFPLVVLLLILNTSESGAAPPIEKERLASILEFPGARIRVEDRTEQVKKASEGDAIISAHFFDSADRSFAPIRIIIGKERTILTEKLESQMEQGLKQLEAKGRPTKLKRISAGTNGRGFAGMALAGPGGSQERVLLTMPDQHRDIEVMITIPHEDPLKVIPEAKNYYEMLGKGTLVHKLVEISDVVAKRNSVGRMGAEIPQSTSTSSEALKSPAQNGGISDAQSRPGSTLAQRSYWPWLLAGGGLLVVCIFLAIGKRTR